MKQITSTYEFTGTHLDESVTVQLTFFHQDNDYTIGVDRFYEICQRRKHDCRQAANICYAYAKAMEQAISFAEKVLSGKEVAIVPDDTPVNVPYHTDDSISDFGNVIGVNLLKTKGKKPMRIKIIKCHDNAKYKHLIGKTYEVIKKIGGFCLIGFIGTDEIWVFDNDCETVTE